MDTMKWKSNLMLLLAAAIWGFAFVAQRVGLEFVGAFTFNGVRFALGSLSLLPFILYQRKAQKSSNTNETFIQAGKAGLITGVILFIGASLQQIGLADTTAGKAAFVTGLYIVIVPMMGILLKHYIKWNSWLGAVLALLGLYFLCMTEQFTIAKGDLYELFGAFFWAVHILLIDHFSSKVDVLKLSFYQLAVCSFLSLTTASFTETITIAGIVEGVIPIMYGGIFAVAIAFTLQAAGQKHAHPSHAAIILSMETVFAAIGGFLLLNEVLSIRGIVGCVLMLGGMLLTQLPVLKKKELGSEAALDTVA